MSVEAVVSLSAAWMAHSSALLAFGGDSAIELFSAVVVYWRFSQSGAASRQSNWHPESQEVFCSRWRGTSRSSLL